MDGCIMEEKRQGQSKLSNYERSKFITRMIGEKGSLQNKLRQELYTTAFDRINKGLKTGNYYEVICLSESVMADRINALIQCLRSEEDDQWTQGSLLDFVRILNDEIRYGGWDRSGIWDEKNDLVLDEVKEWIKGRNRVVHGFVHVTLGDRGLDTEARDRRTRVVATQGEYLTKKVRTLCDKMTRDVWKELKQE